MMLACLAVNPFWVTFGPVLVINAIFLSSFIYFATTGRGRVHQAHDAARRSRSKFLNYFFKEWWIWFTDPIALAFVRLGVGPNLITFFGFMMAVIAAVLFAFGLFGYAGWVMAFGASLDIFDGRVARLTGKESRSGAFFDSVMDRFGEGLCFLGLAMAFHTSWVFPFVIAGLIGSMLVSYTRARGEAVGVDCRVGSMQRPERIVYLGVASILDPVFNLVMLPLWAPPPPILVIGALLFVAVMTNATAIYRMIYIMNSLDTADRRGEETIPQMLTKLSTPEGREAFWEITKKRIQTLGENDRQPPPNGG